MFKRKALDKLISWKNSRHQTCLIINGARQVGKTYIAEYFGRTEYQSFIELNFLIDPSLKSIFNGALSADEILMGINLRNPGTQIIPGNTLLFLDEIQECPNAITALKFLAIDERIDVICSGSALGISYNRVTSYPVGFVDYLDMYSLDFEEFLWARGIDSDVLNYAHNCFIEQRQVPFAINDSLLQYLREYVVLGGMPEVLTAFIEGGSYLAADQVQRRIYRDYLADIARYSAPDIKNKAENCYKSLPIQLLKENHKFQYKTVEEKGTARKFESSLDWLINANMAIKVTNISFIEYPLKAHEIPDNVRLYPNDIGLLTCTYDFSLKEALLKDTDLAENSNSSIVLKTAKGGIWESLVAEMLTKAGHKDLHFYRNEQGTSEMEFIIENADGVIPIEVKAGKSNTRSLNNLLKKDDIKYGYKLASQNVGVSGKKITLPVYMAMWV